MLKVLKDWLSEDKKTTVATEKEIRTVQKIHNSFMTASDLLVKEAKEILEASTNEKLNNLVSKSKQRNDLGFGTTGEQEKACSFIRTSKNLKSLSNEILYYENYFQGLYKVITQSKVLEILKQYGLEWGRAKAFIGEIPDKKLSDINNFIQKYQTKSPKYRFDNEHLSVCAVKNEFGKNWNLYTENSKIKQMVNEDPIVLYNVESRSPINGSGNSLYYIVTGSGPEAKEVVNEINN